jgi:hypothetical protein
MVTFPAPLPGFEAPEKVQSLILNGLQLICSARSRECETGSLIFLLVLKKYVEAFQWVPRKFFTGAVVLDTSKKLTDFGNMYYISINLTAVLEFMKEILEILQDHVQLASTDLGKASTEKPMHGVMMALR